MSLAPLCVPASGTTLLNAFADVARTTSSSSSSVTPSSREEGEGSEAAVQAQLRRVLQLMVVLWGDLPSQCSPGVCVRVRARLCVCVREGGRERERLAL